jgi:hypothetical protein
MFDRQQYDRSVQQVFTDSLTLRTFAAKNGIQVSFRRNPIDTRFQSLGTFGNADSLITALKPWLPDYMILYITRRIAPFAHPYPSYRADWSIPNDKTYLESCF